MLGALGMARFFGIEHGNEGLQFLGQRRLERKTRTGLGMFDNRSGGMQEHASESLACKSLVERKVALLVVASDGVSEMSQMH